MIPQVLTYIQVGFSAAERPRALGQYGMVLALAGVSGPLLGGLLIDADLFGWDWRTIFLINVPIGAAAFLGTAALMPESRAEHTRRLDLVGVVLITLALVAVFYPLVQGRELGRPLWTFISMAAALPCWSSLWRTSGAGPAGTTPRSSTSACSGSEASFPAWWWPWSSSPAAAFSSS